MARLSTSNTVKLILPTALSDPDLKIISWNCNGAFRKKYRSISELNPDICVIQECENPDHVNDHEFKEWVSNYLWTGNNNHKGLGIFADQSIKIERLEWAAQDLQFFLPCRVNSKFNFVGVWASKGKNSTRAYIGQVWQYLQANIDRFHNGENLVLGDFNSNRIWDKKRRVGNHSDVVDGLGQLGIKSLYHAWNSVAQGEEKDATFFLYRNTEKPYHIDYMFGSTAFLDNLNNIEIGDTETWLKLSDHLPVLAEFECHLTGPV
jgi:exonuclease III